MSVAESERGHRRGVVLGFTMAEILLLLLFCLLLISTTALLDKDKEIAALQQQAAVAAGIDAKQLPQSALQLQLLLLLSVILLLPTRTAQPSHQLSLLNSHPLLCHSRIM